MTASYLMCGDSKHNAGEVEAILSAKHGRGLDFVRGKCYLPADVTRLSGKGDNATNKLESVGSSMASKRRIVELNGDYGA
jgi:hypothetical protein